MRVEWFMTAVLLALPVLFVAGCSLVAGVQGEGELAAPLPDPTASGDSSESGTLAIDLVTIPSGQPGTFQFTGVPTGTISADSTLVVADLAPGTYTSTQIDLAPDFDLTAVDCADGGSAFPSSGDAQTWTAVFNLDPGEVVQWTFTNTLIQIVVTPTVVAGSTEGAGSSVTGAGPPVTGPKPSSGGANPFDDPGADLADFPLPEDLPPGAGTFAAPKPGPWSAVNFEGQMVCDALSLSIPAGLPESGVLEVQNGGRTVIGTGLQEDQAASITLTADPEIVGRYTGSIQATEQGVPVTIYYFWQVVTDENVIVYLTASLTSEGVTCSVYRSFEMNYTG